MKYLLGADTCLAFLLGNPEACANWKEHRPGNTVISVMTYLELYDMVQWHSDPTKWKQAIEALSTFIDVIPFDANAAREFLRLKRDEESKSLREATQMLMSVAIANNLTLVTHRSYGIDDIPGLTIVDWVPSANQYGDIPKAKYEWKPYS